MVIACALLAACTREPASPERADLTRAPDEPARADEVWQRALRGTAIDVCDLARAGPSRGDFHYLMYRSRSPLRGVKTHADAWTLLATTRCEGVPVLDVLLAQRSGRALWSLLRPAFREGLAQEARDRLADALRATATPNPNDGAELARLRACLAHHVRARETIAHAGHAASAASRACKAQDLPNPFDCDGRTGDVLGAAAVEEDMP